MKLVFRSGAPRHSFCGLKYHRAGLLIGSHVYGIGFATGGERYRFFVNTGTTVWIWRIAVCRIPADRLLEPEQFGLDPRLSL